MATISLAKIPLLLSFIVLHKIAFYPPNAPPPPEERAKYEHNKSAQESGGFNIITAGSVWKWMLFALSGAESLAILSSLYPQLAAHLPGFLNFLTLSGHAELTISRPFMVGYALMLLGTWLRGAAYREMGRHFTFQLAIRKDHKLVTSGVYSFVRHPSYLASYTWIIGSLVCQMGPGSLFAEGGLWENSWGQIYGMIYSLIAFYMLYVVYVRTRVEDSVLHKEFKGQWEVWAEKTPYRLFPLLY